MSTFKVPFSIAPSGRVARVIDQSEIAKQQITDVLVTSKYERTARPGYGAGAFELLYEPMDPLILGEFKTDAILEVNKYLTNAALVNIFVAPAEVPYFADDLSTTVEITVQYKTALSGIASFSFKITDPTALTEETSL
jgi:phage baseplate assembly protein W